MTTQRPPIACPNCGSRDTREDYDPIEPGYWDCRNCHTWFHRTESLQYEPEA